MSRGRVLALAGLGALLVVLAWGSAAFLVWSQPQPVLPEAVAALGPTPDATFTEGPDERFTWAPTAHTATTGLVLYTGGKVPPSAYAPAARAIAEQGFLVSIVPAPFNLAILDQSAAQAVIDDHPEIRHWAVGGHSLGGATAALFVDGHPGVVEGLVLWAAYSSADIADEDLAVLLSYGTLDQGAATFTDPATLARLGERVTIDRIEGGNHEQMGWYTGQPNDPPATISREEQQRRIVAATVELLSSLDAAPD